MNKNILIIDDENSICEILSSILEDEDYIVNTANSAEEGLEFLKNNKVALVFLDLWLPNMGGMELLSILNKEITNTKVIIISGHANVDIAVQAMKDGAYNCIEKPLDLARILSITSSAIKLYNSEEITNKSKETTISSSSLVGNSAKIKEIKELISQVAVTDSRIMLLGDNGTGKEVIAKEIHNKSLRSNMPFVEVNCAAIPDNLLESELFGHEKGAFTGATESRIGKFEAANGGTLFLDEIADMSLTAQAKVLRAIQEQKFHKVGSNNLISVDIRIITATNKDILKEIEIGHFREDLYFRLSVIPINIPPLKERDEDIIILANHFLQQYNKEHNDNKFLNSESLSLLKEHTWPGNVRELKNFIEKISIISNEQEININNFITLDVKNKNNSDNIENFINLPLSEAKDEFEKKLICSRLKECDGNITKTAKALGIYPSNLHGKIKKYGIIIDK